jgi:DNA-binding SARP family transcriptional activator/DNA-binding XRE family transcriptional regulator
MRQWGMRGFAVRESLNGFGDLVRRRREDAGMTQRDLAGRAGVSVRTLRNLERNLVSRPQVRSVQRLADALGLSGDEPPGPSFTAGPAPALCIGVLGPMSMSRGALPVEIRSATQRRLLGLLAITSGQPVGSREIIDVLWGEQPPRTCLALLHTHVARLRDLLEPDRRVREQARVVERYHDGYRLRLDDVQLDLVSFDRQVARAREAEAAGNLQAAREGYARALECWRGPVLADADARVARHPAAVAASQRRLATTLVYADLSLRLGRLDGVLTTLQALTADEPLHEGLHARLMLVLAGTGEHAAAHALFAQIRARLADELGIEPGSELKAAHLRVLRQDVAAGAAETGDVPAGTCERVTPAQLPADVPAFAGRTDQLRYLDSLVDQAADGREPVVITSIAGTAGVGKTALAIHWAQRVREHFADGQLYVNLRGFDPTDSPMTAAEALRHLLGAFAVPPERIPVDLDAQAALYRSLLSGKRVLVVLDNARSVDQVRPLLPGTPGCLAVVTSRNQLIRLVADGARPVAVDLPDYVESRQMLAARLGAPRTAAEPRAVDEIITLCARLPLALAIVAARAAIHPTFPLGALAAELRADRRGLDAFVDEDPITGLRAAFSWSYRALEGDAARLFRLLGLHPGPDVSPAAAASLAGIPVERAGRLLAALAGANLVTERRPGRFSFHDLLRAYANERVRAVDSAAQRRVALHRLLDHYLHTALACAMRLDPHRDPIVPEPARPGVVGEAILDRRHALDWFTAERPVLLAAIRAASDSTGLDGHRFDPHIWQLTWTLATFLELRGHWHDQVTTQYAAVHAARRLGDRRAQAHAHRAVALARARLGTFDDAVPNLSRALELFDELGDTAGEAHAHFDLAQVLELQGRHREAIHHGERAVNLYRTVDHHVGHARALSSLASCYALIGDYAQAESHCLRCLPLMRRLDDVYGEAFAYDALGYARHHLGRHRDAAACYRQALRLMRQIGERHGEATTLTHLGETRLSCGDAGTARRSWRQALSILDNLGHPDAADVRARLEAL